MTTAQSLPRVLLAAAALISLLFAAIACSDDDDDGETDIAGVQATATGDGGDAPTGATPESATGAGATGATGSTGSATGSTGSGGGAQAGVELTDSSLQAERIQGLEQPTQIVFLAPDDMLVAQKTGSIVRVTGGEVQQQPVLELAANYADERGVLGLTLHPDFETNNWVYVYWTWSGEGSVPDGLLGEATEDLEAVPDFGNRVDRFLWDGQTLTFDTNIIELPSRITDLTLDRRRGNHNAGVIDFGPDGKLYVAIGDQNVRSRLQNVADAPERTGRDALQGVLLRLNDDGSIPDDNPFVDQFEDERGAIYLYGLRNTFGFDFDPDSGELWLEVNGQASYDGLGRYQPGNNLGWIQIMGPPERFEDYRQLELDTDRQLDSPDFPPDMLAETSDAAIDSLFMLEGAEYQPPQFAWRHAIAPTAVQIIEGDGLGEDYAGDMLVGDVNTGTIYHFDLSEDRMSLDLQGDLADGVNDNTEDDPIGELADSVFAKGIAVATDIEISPDGSVWIASSALNGLFHITAGQ